MERNHRLERDLLDRAGVPNQLAVRVLDRLDDYEARNGNTGWDQSVDVLLDEMAEECADIAGWAAGAALQLDEPQFHRLVAAVRFGRFAWEEIEALRGQLRGRG